jgi:hypothetical protein
MEARGNHLETSFSSAENSSFRPHLSYIQISGRSGKVVNPVEISTIIFFCMFDGATLGMWLRGVLPEDLPIKPIPSFTRSFVSASKCGSTDQRRDSE